MRIRLSAILFLVVLFNAVLAGAPRAIQSQPPLPLVCLLPPQALELPAGQGIGVECRLSSSGRAADVTFAATGMPLDRQELPPGSAVAFAWQPSRSGPHTLALMASVDGHEVWSATRQVLVLPAGSPVRIP